MLMWFSARTTRLKQRSYLELPPRGARLHKTKSVVRFPRSKTTIPEQGPKIRKNPRKVCCLNPRGSSEDRKGISHVISKP
jgi:hypothetical protein